MGTNRESIVYRNLITMFSRVPNIFFSMLKTSVITWCFNASTQNIIIDAFYGVGTVLGSRIEGSIQFSHSVLSDSLRPHELQHTRPPCPSPTPRVHPNSCPLSRWCRDRPGQVSSHLFCTTCKPRVTFTFWNSWKKIKYCFITQKNYMNFTYQCL